MREGKRSAALLFLGLLMVGVVVGVAAYRENLRKEFTLVIEAQADRADTLQVFYDLGDGFTEGDSRRVRLIPSSHPRLYQVELRAGAYRKFRIDPVSGGRAHLLVKKIAIYGPDGTLMRSFPLETLRAGKDIASLLLDKKKHVLDIRTPDGARDPVLLVGQSAITLRPGGIRNTVIYKYSIFLLLAAVLVFAYLRSVRGTETLAFMRSRRAVFEGLRTFILLLLVGFMVLFLRNPDPILNPMFVAEDGVWMGSLLTDGLGHTMLHARPEEDYFVWGNVLLLAGGLFVNKVIFGHDLSYLPQMVAITSFAFFSSLAALTYLAVSGVVSRPSAIMMWLLLLLMPLSGAADEILGRLFNIGYAIPVLCVALIMLDENSKGRSGKAHWLLAGGYVLCATTNPVCFPILFFYLGWKSVFRRHGDNGLEIEMARADRWIAVVLIFFAVWIGWRYVNKPPTFIPLAKGEVHMKGLVESVVARTWLFPIVFPFYTHLNDVVTLLLGGLWVTLLVSAWRLGGEASRTFGMIMGLTLLVYTVATFVMRPGLSGYASGYKEDFPVRYFYGQGMLAIMVTLWALDRHVVSRFRMHVRAAGMVTLLFISCNYYFFMPHLFNFSGPGFGVGKSAQFARQVQGIFLESITEHNVDKTYEVPIYPRGWKMEVPSDYVRATALHHP